MGLSRETWLLTLDDRRLVLRRDNPGGAFPIATPLATEFEFHRRLPDTGLPVARALWFIDDPEEVGAIGYVREYIEGGGSPPGLYDPDPRNHEIRGRGGQGACQASCTGPCGGLEGVGTR